MSMSLASALRRAQQIHSPGPIRYGVFAGPPPDSAADRLRRSAPWYSGGIDRAETAVESCGFYEYLERDRAAAYAAREARDKRIHAGGGCQYEPFDRDDRYRHARPCTLCGRREGHGRPPGKDAALRWRVLAAFVERLGGIPAVVAMATQPPNRDALRWREAVLTDSASDS